MSGGSSGAEPGALRGRYDECERIRDLLKAAREGRSGVAVVRGEPGIGKSALLDYAVRLAADITVIRVGGVESEMELPFAALHQFCRPMLPHLDDLPVPQRAAVATAFGMSGGAPPDRFFVGLAVLNLLSEQCAQGPVLCVIDDTQWMDTTSFQTLAFVARRLQAEPVLVLFATRDDDALPGLPNWTLNGLGKDDAHALLESVVWWPMDDEVRERIVEEAHGNPLALLELPMGFSPTQLAGGFALSDARTGSVANRIESSFLRRIQNLPAATQQLMLLAAAEPVGDPQRLWKASALLGLPPSASDSATSAGLLEIGSRVVFRHPLVRSAVYGAASLTDRQKVHDVLAQISDPELDADRRAWHRAQATAEADEAVALELEQSAGRAQARGGWAAAAAFLERSTHLTADPVQRANRARDAADASVLAGAFNQATSLVLLAESGPQDELGRVRDDVLRAKLAFATNHGNEAAALLLAAARRLAQIDLGFARPVFVEAFAAARFAGRSAPQGIFEVAAAAREIGVTTAGEIGTTNLLLEALTELFTKGYVAAAPHVRKALAEFATADISVGEQLSSMWLATVLTADFWDDHAATVINARYLSLARESGALVDLPLALDSRAFLHLFAGQLDAASALVDETRIVCEATGTNLAPYGALCLAAWRGQAEVVTRLVEASLGEITTRGEGAGITVLHYTRALLWNGLGRFDLALEAGIEAMLNAPELAGANWAVVELIEAAARGGEMDLARAEVDRLAGYTSVSATGWARGLEARCKALVSDGPVAEKYYQDAIEHLQRATVRAELARAHLLYGEWLRGENRRQDARAQLRTADAMLTDAGIVGYAERARRSLVAVGERVRPRVAADTDHQMTPQEEQIARLAVEGLTNTEIGARLFISPRTVEWHLRKVFTKLGVTSRRELRQAVPAHSTHG
jgi:DNA-binding CsgD family transcriptional regulator